ncbi:hypothetical protein P9112_003564 [Eukaryota sp. TZLM1-RC]
MTTTSTRAPLSSSYSDQLRRRRLIFTDPAARSLLTDRSQYITFLESQLDRVTSSCLTVDSFSERLNDMAKTINSFDSRISSLTHSISNLQEQRESDLSARASLESSVSHIMERLSVLETDLSKVKLEVSQQGSKVERVQESLDVGLKDFTREIKENYIGREGFVQLKGDVLQVKNETEKLRKDSSDTWSRVSKIGQDVNILAGDQSELINQMSSMQSTTSSLNQHVISLQNSVENWTGIDPNTLKNDIELLQLNLNSLKQGSKESISALLGDIDNLSSVCFKHLDDNKGLVEEFGGLKKLINQINKKVAYIESQFGLKMNSVITKTNEFLDEVLLVENRMNYLEELVKGER